MCREGRAFYYDAGAQIRMCHNAPTAWTLPSPPPDDASITRSAPYLELLFRLAGLRVIAAEDPPDWDADLLPVTHYALAPTGGPAGGAAGAPSVDAPPGDAAAAAAPSGGAAGAVSH